MKKYGPKKCPACGQATAIPVVYGLPDPELMDEAEAGRVALGGCCIIGDELPDYRCTACGHEFPKQPARRSRPTLEPEPVEE